MDRDNNWDRIKHVYDIITNPKNVINICPLKHIKQNYENKIFDECFE
jgi:bisphosphoglycerate-independent phosphoglycerate mutase (AlkP superfamily)